MVIMVLIVLFEIQTILIYLEQKEEEEVLGIQKKVWLAVRLEVPGVVLLLSQIL